MIAPRGVNIIELDRQASTDEAPYGIITADCSDPMEIDDGIFVEDLPTHEEMYRVGVCVADTSKLYEHGDVYRQAMKNTHARYWNLPNGERGYDPMIEPELIKELEFTKGHSRDALVVSFIVGRNQAPSELDISFGKVEVADNLSYKDFAENCKSSERDRKFGRASAFIIQHLQYTSGGDSDQATASSRNPNKIYRRLVRGPSEQVWLRGSRINEAFMVAANHLVGKVFAEEDRPAIYRVHDPADEKFLEFLPADMARYTWTPGLHKGLNLDPYCRVTSPLRRLEDFMMSYQLKQRYLGHLATQRDARDIAGAVQQLNRQLAREVLEGPLRLSVADTLGRGVRKLKPPTLDTAQIIPLYHDAPKAATA